MLDPRWLRYLLSIWFAPSEWGLELGSISERLGTVDVFIEDVTVLECLFAETRARLSTCEITSLLSLSP